MEILNGVKVRFLKKKYYNGKYHDIGEIVLMEKKDVPAYLEVFAIEYYIESSKKKIDEMTYKELQNLCKKNNIAAVGKKEELINSLNQTLL